MIIKSFKKSGVGYLGQDVQSWTQELNNIKDISEVAHDAGKDNLSFFLSKYFPRPPKKILDGGCGVGKYVIYYRKLGYEIVGVDFSGETVGRVKSGIGLDVPIYEANITKLPFADESFDCYFSGGVIEHFEEGPDVPLKEARRVLKKGGTFLATVPYVNLLRRSYFTFFPTKRKNGIMQKVCRDNQCNSIKIDSYKFCEYFFDFKSLAPYFKKNGLLIERSWPTGFLWGEIGLLLKGTFERYELGKQKNKADEVKNRSLPQEGGGNKHGFNRFAYDFLISENLGNKLFYLPLTILNYLSGNVIFVVARAV
jgi:SAM-dependent methyltransferase